MKREHVRLTLQQGSVVYVGNHPYTIIQLIDLEYILVESTIDGNIKRLRISDTTTAPLDDSPVKTTLHAIDALPDKDWQIAQKRLEIIRPLAHKAGRTVEDVEQVALSYDLHRNTIYKWLRLYEQGGLLASLAPNKRSDAGSRKLSPEAEAIVSACIEDEYLTKQQKSISILYTEIKRQCRNTGISAPHVNTIRGRVNQLAEDLKIRRRFGSKKAQDKLHMNEGAFPHAEYPLSVIQIDHTLLDIILVDDDHRLPMQRPWITMAIDVYSRLVVGFYISLDPPGSVSVGACLSHAILPKDNWLAEHDIDTPWPCWGIPRTVHADNAKEFRGRMLQLACDQYGITLEWRPVARPHFGAHIERLLGTFAKKIHALPGTTFSNTVQREGYDSEKESAFTLKELENWLGQLIVKSYHHSYHTGINCSPMSKYEQGILGNSNSKGVGLPERISDEETLRINFLPYVERTIQAYGIQIDNVCYYHDVLRVWINSTVEGQRKVKRKFIFRRDPRDISVVWFFDPQLEMYYPIPYRNTSFPAVSIWEFNAALNRLKEEGRSTVNEDIIFDAIEKMRVIEKTAVQTTKKARKAHQKRKSSSRKSIRSQIGNESLSNPVVQEEQYIEEEDDSPILPFDELLDVKRYD
ncbi:DDE-type integrase/transposase/recombinase [Motilimonas cestriensis]|uniref:DDE-type integrase/transposase/recombinase n=1 Tax=Motilimonas cestriensis TaxID=2742685 RepID=A0ABS8W7C3_9GAMM|nr:helix-turn-helix domain-containing protein [Motilimonas cestriensis]MCE2594113.1 DDE-type integrase/transposase/recombinase [Motilimonas cestriensis]